MKKIILTALFCALIISHNVVAQRVYSSRYNYHTVGFHLNSFNYLGDLNPKTNVMSTNLALTSFGIGTDITFKIAQNVRYRSMLSIGQIRGNDASSADPNDDKAVFRYARNLHFRNTIVEVAQHIIYDFVPGKGRFYRRPAVAPYVFTGAAIVYSNPRGRTPDTLGYGGKWVNLRPLQTEGKKYSAFSIAIPMGLGVRFKIGDRIDIGIEGCLRLTFTDYLDDVSGNYTSLDKLPNDLARRMANRTAETVSRFNDKTRDMSKLTPILGTPLTENSTDGGGYRRLAGMGTEGDIRGLPAKDAYFTFGVTGSYVIGIKQYRPRNQKGR